jgi:hypothetical protein
MGKLENYNQLLNVLKYGRKNGVSAKRLAGNFEVTNLLEFKRKIRALAHEARFNGHWIIGDSNGYSIALNRSEWDIYKKQRLLATNNELKAIANCDNISFADLIKTVYGIIPTDKNYELF